MAGRHRSRVALRLERKLLTQGRIGILPAISTDWRTDSILQLRKRTQPRIAPQALSAAVFRRVETGELVGAEFEEAHIHLLAERHIKPVDPGHRLIGDVLVAVPIAARCKQQVAPAHPDRIAVHDCPDPLAFDDEAEGVLAVAVFGGHLAWPQVLDRSPQGRADIGMWRQPRIAEPDRAPLAPAPDWHQFARALRQWQQPGPPPDVRNRLGLGVNRHEIAQLGPQGQEALLFEPAVQFAQFGRIFRLHRMDDSGVIERFVHDASPAVLVIRHRAGWAALRLERPADRPTRRRSAQWLARFRAEWRSAGCSRPGRKGRCQRALAHRHG